MLGPGQEMANLKEPFGPGWFPSQQNPYILASGQLVSIEQAEGTGCLP